VVLISFSISVLQLLFVEFILSENEGLRTGETKGQVERGLAGPFSMF
jgi:hypothetical protein